MVELANIFSLIADLAASRLNQTQNCLTGGRFTAARFTGQTEYFTTAKRKIKTVNRPDLRYLLAGQGCKKTGASCKVHF
jgi:hypothetical protein